MTRSHNIVDKSTSNDGDIHICWCPCDPCDSGHWAILHSEKLCSKCLKASSWNLATLAYKLKSDVTGNEWKDNMPTETKTLARQQFQIEWIHSCLSGFIFKSTRKIKCFGNQTTSKPHDKQIARSTRTVLQYNYVSLSPFKKTPRALTKHNGIQVTSCKVYAWLYELLVEFNSKKPTGD